MFNINCLPSWWSFVPRQRRDRRSTGTNHAAALFWVVLIVFLAWLGLWNLLIVPVAVVALAAYVRWTQRSWRRQKTTISGASASTLATTLGITPP